MHTRTVVLTVSMVALFHVMTMAASPMVTGAGTSTESLEPPGPEWVLVESVHVGDHIRVLIGDVSEKVRLIGVDTPGFIDAVNAAQIAEAYSVLTRDLTEGEMVRLESDRRVPDRDDQGDLLRYVYLEDGTLVNAEIIKQGYGRVDPAYPFTRSEQFLELHAQAVDRRVGLHKSWNPDLSGEVTPPKLITSSRVPPSYPEKERKRSGEVKVILQGVIQKDGSVRDLAVLRSPGRAFEEAAIAAVGQWKYQPATKNGEPVTVYFAIVVEFQLEKSDD